MPPVRTMPSAKPIKTERTHEENQERAYIAASRRSDRSLEARIESARRASEIHKRRTGRSLRVTEQDVINEEMYEEEDDDLPMQYRRLTAHLQTTNAQFDRRLAAFLTNQVAMRTALGQAVSDSWQQNSPFHNMTQFMNQDMVSMQQQPSFQQNPMLPPQGPPQGINRSPTTYRQSPYPMPNQQGMQHNYHGRSMSVATPQESSNYQQQQQSAQSSPVDSVKPDDRRMSAAQSNLPHTPQSLPGAQISNQGSPVISRNPSVTSLSGAQQKHFAQPSPQQQPTPPQYARSQNRAPAFPSPFPGGNYMDYSNMNFSPLSATLPMDSQQMFSNAPMAFNESPAVMMQTPGGSYKPTQPFYSYNPNGKPKGSSPTNSMSPSSGMNQTLVAPSMLDTTFTLPSDCGAADGLVSPFAPQGLGLSCDTFGYDMFKDNGLSTSGQITPTDGDWQGLLVDSAWEQAPVL